MPSFGVSTDCRLLAHPPADGAWNMACDEALLSEVARSGVPVLRFYQWQQPTLSLGYFQQFENRAEHPASQAAAVVRRLSGGGAILHDRELTYSLFLPSSHALSRDTQQLYDVVHQSIIEVLNALLSAADAPARAALCEPTSNVAASAEPFLCFQRRTRGDILLRNNNERSSIDESKVVGSAQRRRQNVVLQHGSLLLAQSPLAPELPGIAEIAEVNVSALDLLGRLPECLARNLSLNLLPSELPDGDFDARISNLQREKYEATCWTQRR